MAGLNFGSSADASYLHYARQGKMFNAMAIVTAPVIYTTAAGTGGPLLWNGTTNKNAVLLAVTCGITVVTTVAASLGITGNSGQTTAPSATTAIDSVANCLIGRSASSCNVYRVGTPASAGNFFFPFLSLHTGALTVDTDPLGFIDLGGSIVVPPGSWASIAASATATTTVANLGLLWAEIDL